MRNCFNFPAFNANIMQNKMYIVKYESDGDGHFACF